MSSHVKIKVKCDICGEERIISYQNYNKCTKNQTEIYTCTKCKSIKSEKTCMEKYGCKNPLQSKEIKYKIKKTNFERYGVEFPIQNHEIYKKVEQTCEQKYGVKNVFANKDIQQKIKHTINDKYGVDYVIQSEDIKKQNFTN